MFGIRSLIACTVAAVCLLGPSDTQAQWRGGRGGGNNFSFGFGNGGFGASYGRGGYGGGYGGWGGRGFGGWGNRGWGGNGWYGSNYNSGYYGSNYYYPSYGYSYPTYTSPTYVTPSYSYPSTTIVDNSAPSPVFDGGTIVILAPASNERSVEYTLNDNNYSMRPGQSQTFRHDRHWVVQFDSGTGRGPMQYTLKAGTYKFKQTADGWQLFSSSTPSPTPEPVSGGPGAPVPMP